MDGKSLDPLEYLNYLEDFISTYRSWLYSIEDPFEENSFDMFGVLQRKFKRIIMVGDDLLATNVRRLKTALAKDSVRGAIVKPNQVGSVRETLEFIKLAKENGVKTIISHRSGETCDSFIIHLAVATGGGLVKIGAPNRGERVEKYNEIIRILEGLR